MRRGEVWWYERPDEKRRPAIILTRNESIDHRHSVIAAPTTGTARGWDTEVALDRDDGMPDPCVAQLDNVFYARKARLTERITELGPDKMDKICRALALATNC
jgi:mRNA-degrading endonuclease toxin of MazEF toxin-antitoxin module